MIVKPLTLRTLQYYNPIARKTKIKQEHIDGVAVYEDRHLAAIYGFIYGMSLQAEYDTPTAMAFICISDYARRRAKTIWSEAKHFRDHAIPAVQEKGYTVIAYADQRIENAAQFITRLGGQPTEFDGEYVWPIQ